VKGKESSKGRKRKNDGEMRERDGEKVGHEKERRRETVIL
jgi:hypothetical protein